MNGAVPAVPVAWRPYCLRPLVCRLAWRAGSGAPHFRLRSPIRIRVTWEPGTRLRALRGRRLRCHLRGRRAGARRPVPRRGRLGRLSRGKQVRGSRGQGRRIRMVERAFALQTARGFRFGWLAGWLAGRGRVPDQRCGADACAVGPPDYPRVVRVRMVGGGIGWAGCDAAHPEGGAGTQRAPAPVRRGTEMCGMTPTPLLAGAASLRHTETVSRASTSHRMTYPRQRAS